MALTSIGAYEATTRVDSRTFRDHGKDVERMYLRARDDHAVANSTVVREYERYRRDYKGPMSVGAFMTGVLGKEFYMAIPNGVARLPSYRGPSNLENDYWRELASRPPAPASPSRSKLLLLLKG